MTEWCWAGCNGDCITSLVMLLKNAPSLSILARHGKNVVLTGTRWKISGPSGVSRLTDLIDKALAISNVKFVNSAIVLLSWTEVSSCCNTLSWPISSID